jgi:hypothetical protein
MKESREIPTPAHFNKRREALPWQQPKAIEEDPEAMRRVQAILESASYRPADTDIAFLAEDDLRGVRLQIDYLKPELLLREHEISQTSWSSAARGSASLLLRIERCRRCERCCPPIRKISTLGGSWELLSELLPKAISMR